MKRQSVPVIVVEDAAALPHAGQHMVIGAQQKEIPGSVAVVAGDLRDADLIQRDGDGAHAVLGQHLPQQPGELVQLHGLVPKDLHELIQHAAEDLPQLSRLLRILEPASRRLLLHLFFQRGLKPQRLQKRVKAVYFLPSCFPSFQIFRKCQQRQSDPAAEGIDLRQLFLPCLVPGCAVAVRILRPVRIPQPHGAVDFPFEHVVFQQIALLRCQSGQTGLEPAEHILVLIAVAHRIQHAGQQAQGGFFQNITAAAQIGRDAVSLEYRLDHPFVIRHIPGGHYDLPIPAHTRRRQSADLRRRLLHLGKDGVRLQQTDGTALSLIGQVLSKKAALQMAQCGPVLCCEVLYLYRYAFLLRQTAKLLQCPLRSGEDLLAAVLLPQQRHCDRSCLP
ncbi:unknown [Oscillibacter sp. CAG:155]|nr:unknown [Oscillibacter sp. CAG:155]